MQFNCNLNDIDTLKIVFLGDLVSSKNDSNNDEVFELIKKNKIKKIEIDASSSQNWDISFIVFLFEICKLCKNKKIEIKSQIPNGAKRLLDLAFADNRNPEIKKQEKLPFINNLGMGMIKTNDAFMSGARFLRTVVSSLKRLFLGRAIMRKLDFLFALEDCSFKAFGIVSLICFMVGVIFGFVGAMQLKLFGAEIFVASLVMIAMTRVMGAVMTGIIMAGRTGSAYAATIGTMQVNEEIDALKTMGINVIDFLLLPRMLALIITMPILTVFADVMGVLGGAFVGIFMLDLAPGEYWNYSVTTLTATHFLIGILYGAVFGVVIALCGCYYGIKSGKDADSVGKAATSAVVASIVWIIITTAILTLIFQVVGI